MFPWIQYLQEFIFPLPGINGSDKCVHKNLGILNAMYYVGLDPGTEKGHWWKTDKI